METLDYLNLIKNEIHSCVFATVDENGLPVTRVIDMMLADEQGLYFITATGKEFYRQLTEQKFAAVSGMTQGADSLHKKAVSVRGKVKNLGSEKLEEVFRENPYMAEIYPNPESRKVLEVFQIYEGTGEFFDLSTKPITRATFYLGKHDQDESKTGGYYMTEKCKKCGKCVGVCPQNCIELSEDRAVIRQEHCLHCGNCMKICPFGAVEKR